MSQIRSFLTFFSLLLFCSPAWTQSDNLRFNADVYAVHTHLLPYKGTEDTLALTLGFKYADFMAPFIRGTTSQFYYLNELIPLGNQSYTSDTRTAYGGGVDFVLLKSLRVRFIHEWIDNKNANTAYDQFSYGLIYNDYLSVGAFDLNNYAEAFSIPRVSSSEWDFFARIQALKSFDILKTHRSVQAVYPFVQLKVKENDNLLFGVSGQNASTGVGYKFIQDTSTLSQLSFILEGHTLLYQSRDFNSDWNQVLAALQYTYK